MASRIQRAIHSPKIILIYLLHRTGWLYSDRSYLKALFRLEMGYKLNLDNPQTFNEKLNWLKLYNRNPLYTKLADKYEAKLYVKEKIGEKYIVPCYGVWNNVNEVDFTALPNRFVMKVTGDSSGVIICKDKNNLNFDEAKVKLSRWQKNNYYHLLREWVYKDINSRIIAEEFLDDKSGHELKDYKFWCFNGVPKIMYITNKATDIFENFYDMDFNALEINHGHRRNVPEFEKPDAFDEMKSIAASLSQGIPFVRIDFYYVNHRVYFGEFTFYDWGGMRPFSSYDRDLELGSWLKI